MPAGWVTAGARRLVRRRPRAFRGKYCDRSRDNDGNRAEQDVQQAPYNQARRVFWIMDNGSSHRGARCVTQLQEKFPRLVAVHGPVHASWAQSDEIYFSIVQRKFLTPNDFPSLAAVAERLLAFQTHYEAIAQPFEWKFTRRNLAALLHKIVPPPTHHCGWPHDRQYVCGFVNQSTKRSGPTRYGATR